MGSNRTVGWRSTTLFRRATMHIAKRAPFGEGRNLFEALREGMMKRLSVTAVGALLCLFTGNAHADVVTDWNVTTLQVLRAVQAVGGAQSRTLAMVHVAMSDAVNSVQNRYTRYAAKGPIMPNASAEAAAATAAWHVLTQLYPNQKATIDEAYMASIKAIAEGPAKIQGVELGEQAATAVLADRATDGATEPDTYRPNTSPGVWVPTAPPVTEQYARARPWVLNSANQFRPGPPPQLSSAPYARDYNETKSLGGRESKVRTTDQTAAVRFWTTPNLAPAWQAAARQLATTRELPLAECARLFALLNMAVGNSFITDWDAKFTYNFWRPLTAIRNGDLDGNDATERDPGWSPLAVTPMHPEYPSQAAISAGVSIGILTAVFGPNPGIAPAATDIADPKRTRRLNSIAAMAEEHRNVRVWGGIHFRNSLNVGDYMGKKIADYLVENAIKPVR
jgi:hypothetical protein